MRKLMIVTACRFQPFRPFASDLRQDEPAAECDAARREERKEGCNNTGDEDGRKKKGHDREGRQRRCRGDKDRMREEKRRKTEKRVKGREREQWRDKVMNMLRSRRRSAVLWWMVKRCSLHKRLSGPSWNSQKKGKVKKGEERHSGNRERKDEQREEERDKELLSQNYMFLSVSWQHPSWGQCRGADIAVIMPFQEFECQSRDYLVFNVFKKTYHLPTDQAKRSKTLTEIDHC